MSVLRQPRKEKDVRLDQWRLKRLKVCIAGSQSLTATGRQLPWDHTVLPATRHKWTRPALTPHSKPTQVLLTPEGLKAELTEATRQYNGGSRTRDLSITCPTS